MEERRGDCQDNKKLAGSYHGRSAHVIRNIHVLDGIENYLVGQDSHFST